MSSTVTNRLTAGRIVLVGEGLPHDLEAALTRDGRVVFAESTLPPAIASAETSAPQCMLLWSERVDDDLRAQLRALRAACARVQIGLMTPAANARDADSLMAAHEVQACLDESLDTATLVRWTTTLLDDHRRLTDGDRAREAAERSYASRLLSLMTSIVISVDGRGVVRQWNQSAASVFELGPAQAIGRYFDLLPLRWGSPTTTADLWRARLSDGPVQLDDRVVHRKSGGSRVVTFTVRAVPDPMTGEKGLLVIGEDVTENKLLHQQLAQAQKLEAIGQLAAGVAHEINTPMQFIADNLSFLQTSFNELLAPLAALGPRDAANENVEDSVAVLASAREIAAAADLDYLTTEVPAALQQALDGVARVAKLVRAMKEFSHPGGEEKTAVDVNHAIETTLAVCRAEWKHVAEVETAFDAELPAIPALGGELNQVFLNIIVNAAHALADRADDRPPGLIRVTTRCSTDDHIIIEIEDNGTGMSDAIRERIFDPFFTTKEVGKGTGQGLAIARSVVVDKHDGTIECHSEPGAGTRFVIRLPATQAQVSVPPSVYEGNEQVEAE